MVSDFCVSLYKAAVRFRPVSTCNIFKTFKRLLVLFLPVFYHFCRFLPVWNSINTIPKMVKTHRNESNSNHKRCFNFLKAEVFE